MSHIRELKVGIGSYTAGDDVLQVEGNVSVVGVVSTTSGIDITGVSTLAGNVFVGSAVSIYASSGIVSATSFYGDGSNLTGVSGSGISDVVEDTTPQLGGNLDLNSKDITGTGNLNITGVVTATSFVGSLTGSASSLSGVSSSFLLDYNNFSNTPTIPTNNNQLTNGAGYITTSFTNTNQLTNGAGFITTSFTNTNQLTNGAGFVTFTNNNQLTNGAGYITTSFTNTNQLTNGAGFITSSDNISGTAAGLSGSPDIAVTNITSGIVTATTFVGSLTGSATSLSGVSSSFLLDYNNFTNTPTIPTNNNQLTNGAGYITTSFTNTNQLTNGAGFITSSDDISGTSAGLSGSPSITVNAISATSAEFSGNVTIGGTLTYEDVTNIDSVGVVTARLGVNVTGGEISVGAAFSVGQAGVVTATTFDGSLATSNLTGTITNAQLAGSIANAKLANSSIAIGGVTFNLGDTDATPAFDLSDATSYPFTSLTGVTTEISADTTPQLGGNLDLNSKDITGTGNLNITGVSTISTGVGTVHVGLGDTTLLVDGNARVTGILTIGTGSITLDPTAKKIEGIEEIIIGAANTITIKQDDKGEIEFTDATGAQKSVGIGTTVSINTSGIITATSFVVGDDKEIKLGDSQDLKVLHSTLNRIVISASDGADNDMYGNSVAIGTSKIVIGAYLDDDGGSGTGSAYIYDHDGSNQVKINASDAAADDNFGEMVGIGGTIVVVAADGADGVATNAGKAYIFDLSGNELGIVTASDGAANDRFGYSVAVGTSKFVVGAVYNDDAGTSSGSAYIFDHDGSNQVKITASDASSGDYFGESVAIGATIIAVGARAASTGGALYLFDHSGNQLQKINPSNSASGDNFGSAVSVGPTKIIVGAWSDDGDGGEAQGSAYIYDIDGTNEIKLTASDGAAYDYYGKSVAAGPTYVFVGTTQGDEGATNSGVVYRYELDGSNETKLTSNDPQSNGGFGYSVAVGSGKVLIGERDGDGTNADGSGAAHLFNENVGSHLDNITGDLFIQNASNNINSNIFIRARPDENSIICNDDGSVELYYNAARKLETISTGATVTGDLYATTFYGDGSNLTGVSGSGISNVVEDTTPQLGGNLDLNSKTINGTGNINITGVVTATTFDGSLATSNLSGTVTNAQLAGSIANAKLANSSIAIGGVTLNLGDTDATPAFDLSDATDYPFTSLTGITTVISGDTTPTLGGNLDANSKDITGINNINVSGIATATTFDGSLATSNLSGTITNAQLAGSIANAKLANSSIAIGGVTLNLGDTDATPAFDLSDATDYPFASLTGVTTEVSGDTTPQLGGDLDLNSKNVTGTGSMNVTGIITATSFGGSAANMTNLTGASAATYGDASNSAQIVVDANGRITSISNVSISGGGGGGGSSGISTGKAIALSFIFG